MAADDHTLEVADLQVKQYADEDSTLAVIKRDYLDAAREADERGHDEDAAAFRSAATRFPVSAAPPRD